MRGTGLKLVAFTVFTVFITFYLARIIGNIDPFQKAYAVEAEFSDATGVLVGDLVKIAGVDVGKVSTFEAREGKAIVTLEIDGEVKLPKNVIADIKFRNLVGQRVINLQRPAQPSTEMLDDGDTIPIDQTKPALDLTVFFNNLRPLIHTTNPEDINTVSRAILAVFEGREGELAGLLDNVGELTQTLAARDQRLARLVTDLDDLTKVLNGRSQSIRVGLTQFTEVMEALAEVTPTIRRVIDQLDTASRKFGGILDKNHSRINQEVRDLAVLLGIVTDNLPAVDKVAKNLKEVLLATARSQSYAEWWNLYIVNFCPETGLPGGLPDDLQALGCQR